ncbi:Ig-like domain repeat protein [Sanguibacter sp. 4.1]|uniref:Ig-like domain repeat protein n=1 Tax=Sanguibacter biliveldensis TaxID=3030830 RepID=A0AAF0Z907_9MICO|nr:Ig-like domain repeat protein [Sanguibacter sp. 4.1]WPF82746.1 Ig-like domain repeat protein [Sanguibacter sp. 4.1]
MRTRRTPAPHTSQPRATRLRGLVAALLTAPLALGTLAATALPAAAEPEAPKGKVTVDSTVPVGEPVQVSFTCPTDPDHVLGSMGYMVDETTGLVSLGEGFPVTPAPGVTSFTAERTVTFPVAGEYRVELFCHNGFDGDAVWIQAGDLAPVAEATSVEMRFFPDVVESHNPISVEATVTTKTGRATAGTVQFSIGGTPVSQVLSVDSAGYVSTTFPSPGPGTQSVTATYTGTELFTGSSSSRDVFVKAKAVVSTVVPDRVRAPHTALSATVASAGGLPVPTGTVTFRYSEGAVLGEAPLVDGTANLALPDLAPSVYDGVFAVYSGDTSYSQGGSARRDMIVDRPLAPLKSPAVVTVGVPLAITGTQVPVKVTVAPGMHETSTSVAGVGTPSGTVAVSLGKGGPRQTVTLVDGTASAVFDSVAPGTYEVEAFYTGDTHFDVGAGYAPTTVTAPVVTPPVTPPVVTPPVAPDLSGSTSTLPAGGTITLVARDFLPGETVSFYLHSDPIFLGTAVADANGVATLVVAIPAGAPAGEHHVRATGATSLRTAEIPVTVTAAPVVTAPIVTVPVAVPVVTPVAAAPVAAAVPAVAAPLASTGAELGSTVLLVSVLLGSGVLLLAGRRRFASLAG